mmetsp:Transcript_38790/g.116608  ORF Transcript_38790/g.116608 Transcript_38790/m.116608 type:complete len:202 (-) Transcript_38790:142-747(-)
MFPINNLSFRKQIFKCATPEILRQTNRIKHHQQVNFYPINNWVTLKIMPKSCQRLFYICNHVSAFCDNRRTYSLSDMDCALSIMCAGFPPAMLRYRCESGESPPLTILSNKILRLVSFRTCRHALPKSSAPTSISSGPGSYSCLSAEVEETSSCDFEVRSTLDVLLLSSSVATKLISTESLSSTPSKIIKTFIGLRILTKS